MSLSGPHTDEALQWLPEYDAVLTTIASTDSVAVEWVKLRAIIKHKISENITLFQENREPPPPPPAFVPTPLQSGGLKLPPFPPRRQSPLTSFEIPVNYMNDEQAAQMKQYIFDQLDQFESNPPFTIQRVCELCIDPKRHYKAIGKYLRAVEKSLLVTSTWDSFPPLQESDLNNPTRSLTVSASTAQSTPSTPLFSPIAFLHADARRSRSRSPPPSPLNLAVSGGPEPLETKSLGLGLVDELDAPGPGHMSEHPTALSAVTSIEDKKEGTPIIESLESRFVKAGASMHSEDSMVVDENKENARS
ncbi:PPP4R2-domain-containing protein, partial [Marasmius fiardii PR-910]